ncbi:MAG: ribose 5-phosphate isomerase B [Candidatus Aminicenantales bacterium]
MKIALASDHAGFRLKKGILNYLDERRIEHHDFGCYSEESVDYVDFGARAVRAVVGGEFERAILICGTGLGMSIVANKFRGIRATACWDEITAELSRLHNNSNCLTLGGRVLDLDEALVIVKVWLETKFEEGRHTPRIDKILRLEEENFK